MHTIKIISKTEYPFPPEIIMLLTIIFCSASMYVCKVEMYCNVCMYASYVMHCNVCMDASVQWAEIWNSTYLAPRTEESLSYLPTAMPKWAINVVWILVPTMHPWLSLYSILKHSAKVSLAPSINSRWVTFIAVGDWRYYDDSIVCIYTLPLK